MGIEQKVQVLYEREGGVLAVQTPSNRESFREGLRDSKVINALAACRMNVKLAEELFVNFSSIPAVSEEDQFTKGQDKQKTEHVIIRETDYDGKKIKLLQVDFYPPAVGHGGETIGGIFTNTAEIIFGLEGQGVLEVVPVITQDGKIFPDLKNAQDVTIGKGTLVILPPNVQGNRWKSMKPTTGEEPSLRALFVAFPEPYENAVTRKFDLKP